MILSLTRKLEISYGHNISSQKLSERESLGGLAKCRRFHGHNSNIEIHLGVTGSDDICINEEAQMVTDANNLKGLEAEINKYFDHKTYVSNFAPELNSILNFFKTEDTVDIIENSCPYLVNKEIGFIFIKNEKKFIELCKKINVDVNIQKNYFDSFLIIKGETTIENMSRILYTFVQNYLSQKINKDSDTKFIDSKGNKLNYNIQCRKIVWSETNKSSAEYVEG